MCAGDADLIGIGSAGRSIAQHETAQARETLVHPAELIVRVDVGNYPLCSIAIIRRPQLLHSSFTAPRYPNQSRRDERQRSHHMLA
jgi:hypothetical protein